MAMVNLANTYLRLGDRDQAFVLSTRAADLGNHGGMLILGNLYVWGTPLIKPDYVKAREWYNKALKTIQDSDPKLISPRAVNEVEAKLKNLDQKKAAEKKEEEKK